MCTILLIRRLSLPIITWIFKTIILNLLTVAVIDIIPHRVFLDKVQQYRNIGKYCRIDVWRTGSHRIIIMQAPGTNQSNYCAPVLLSFNEYK